ncbi:MAG: Ig-like domain-containing protein [Roseiflexus sp.]
MKRPSLFTFFLLIHLMAGMMVPAYAHDEPPTPIGGDEPATATGVIAETPEVWSTDASTGRLSLRDHTVFWAAQPSSCAPAGVEFPYPCQIRSRYVNGSPSGIPTRTAHNAGAAGPFIQSNIAVDNTHMYWIDSNFRIRRLARSAAAGTTPEVIGNTAYTTSTLLFEVDVDDNFVFWTESDYGSPASGRLHRMPKAGGERQLMAQSGFRFLQLRADGAGGAYYVVTFLNILSHTTPGSSGFTTDSPFVAVDSYALTGTHIYWADRISGRLRIKRAPRSNPSAAETLADRGNVGSPRAPVIAVDSENVYWQEVRGSNGPFYRRRLAGGEPEQITDTRQGASSLVSNGRYLLWNEGSIYRLPVNASTWTLDLGVSGLEVVQTIQGPTNDVPLVSGKETFVRAFPRILSSAPSRTSINMWPNILLYGTRGGSPLPGSPLEPLPAIGAPRSVNAAGPDRSNLNSGVWFRLPASWTDGAVQLRAVVNPSRVQSETNYTNNEATLSVSFVRKAPICLDIKPVSTERGVTIAAWPRDEGIRNFVQSFFRRAEQLLPTHEIQVFMRGGDPLRKPRWYLFERDPFGLSTTNADSGWMLFLLHMATLFDRNLCPDGGKTIRTVMAQDFPNREVNGMALWNNVLFFTFWEPLGGFPQNVPGGGVTLAHEIGHTYGRGHVNCPEGVPDSVDGGYPHPPCQIGTPGTYIGFDNGSLSPSRTPALLLPENTGDLMSYAHFIPKPRWTSDYTWRGIFNEIGARSMALPAGTTDPLTTQATLSFIVTGFISGTVAEMRETFQLPEPLLSQVTTQINASTTASAAYRLRAFNGTTLLANEPLRIVETEFDGNPGMPGVTITGFFQRLDLPTRPTRIEVVRVSDNSVIGGFDSTPNPPSVTLIEPTGSSSVDRTLTIRWNASDPDGGLLHHMVRYSADNGATWTVLGQSLTSTLLTVDIGAMPGGAAARVQIITTDGLNTTIITSDPFAVAQRRPEVDILPDGGPSFDSGDPVILRSRAYDPEDGFLSGARLQWQVNGPVSATGDGNQLTLLNLPPGAYTIRLTATDSDGNTGEATAQINVAPKRIVDGTAPEVDGYCDDSAYNADPHPISLRYNEGTPSATVAQVRFVRSGDYVYACFSGLPLSSSATEAAILKFDVDNSADPFQQPDDVIFVLQRDGLALSGRGNNSAASVFDPETRGMIGAVSATDVGWSAEMRIEASRLGGWNKLVRMLVFHDPRVLWPSGSVAHEPRRWGLTALGTPPASGFQVYLPLIAR